jgi:formylglycine-generating enzyme required for sulfatase activity
MKKEVITKIAVILLTAIIVFAGCRKDDDGNPLTPNGARNMVLIPARTFRMGNLTNNPIGDPDEKPAHTVTITQLFHMNRTEVTQAQWKTVMGSNPSYFKGDSLPVERVSWYDAVEYCNRLSKSEGLDTCYRGSGRSTTCDFTANGYRLPTEAEWEYACRGWTETDFYTGNITNSGCTPLDPALNRAGWYCGNENTKTRNVGLKEPNAFGLFDMHGNVWEWCWDWYSDSYFTANPAIDPRGPARGSYRVLRGGSWFDYAGICRSSSRYSFIDPDLRFNYIGFRIVKTY